MSSSSNPSRETRTGVLGVGLDAKDGHKRVTQGDDFLLVGGSHETHERMQDMVVRMSERVKRKGKTFRDLSKDEFADLARESLEE